jgi:hypothetical protein
VEHLLDSFGSLSKCLLNTEILGKLFEQVGGATCWKLKARLNGAKGDLFVHSG